MKRISLVCYVLFLSSGIVAQVINPTQVLPLSISDFGVAVQENFNSLTMTDSSDVVPYGWQVRESGAVMNNYYTAGNGSSNRGDIYSYGSISSTDRALGSLFTTQMAPYFGAYFINNTGDTIKAITISYTGEQWRLGSTGRLDKLDFQYNLSATSVNTIFGWIDVNELDFVSPTTVSPTGLKDGNDPAFQTKLLHTINGLNILPGQTIFFRFFDIDASNTDDGLAVDDFVLVAHKNTFLPVVATVHAHNLLSNIVQTTGIVHTSGNNPVTVRGIIIGTNTNPTITNNTFKTIDGNGLGEFNSEINTLQPNTTYYLRTYAESAVGVGYGEEIVFTTPAPAAYYRSVSSGVWSNPAIWETATDISSNWIPASIPPSYFDNTIRIRSGHHISFSTSIIIDQVIVEAGAILERAGGDLSIHNGYGDDLVIFGKYLHSGGTTIPSFNGTMRIKTGGILEVIINNSSSYYGMNNKIFYETDAVYYWNVATSATIINGTYFPNATINEIPVFRIKVGGFSFGGNISNPTIVNGIFDIEAGTITVQHNGPKIFRNGIRGAGNLVQKSGTNECGPIIINGEYAEIGGSGAITLNSNGLEVTTGSTLNFKSGKTINSASSSINGNIFINGIVDFKTFQITGSAHISFLNQSKIISAHSVGINGALLNTGTKLFSDKISIVFNGILPQTTGNLMPDQIANLIINNSGSGVTLSMPLTINTELDFQNGKLFTSGSEILTISNASIAGASTNSFINGPVIINSTSAGEKFLPVGKSGIYKPIVLLPLNSISSFLVEYFNSGHSNLNTGNNISAISHSEYWNIESLTGEEPVKIKLLWSNDQLFTNTDNLIVAKFNGVMWENIGDGATVNGTLAQGSITSFTTNNANAVTFGFLSFGGALPVTLTHFEGKRNKSTVNLNWKTENEYNNSHFEIERSINDDSFEMIGIINGNGTTAINNNYSFIDNEAPPEKTYYRLKQVDFNGAYEYHKVIMVNSIEINVEVNLFPIPASDVLNINFTGKGDTFFDMAISDISGKILYTRNISSKENLISIDISDFKSGFYYLILSGDNKLTNIKWIKQ